MVSLKIAIKPDKGPIYRQIADQITAQICNHMLPKGSKLPSAKDLGILAGVNPNTVIHAFGQLELAKITENKRGLGTFVREDLDLDSLRSEMLRTMTRQYLAELKNWGFSQNEVLAMIKKETHGDM